MSVLAIYPSCFYKFDTMEKLPPVEKVFEAWTALVDGRVILHDGYADVASSDGTKGYTVRFDGNRYSSDDNATFWRGYAGYPVLAVLMLQGRLPYYPEEASQWKGVNWKAINTRHRNDYAAAVEEVARERGIDLEEAYRRANAVMEALRNLPVEIKRKI